MITRENHLKIIDNLINLPLKFLFLTHLNRRLPKTSNFALSQISKHLKQMLGSFYPRRFLFFTDNLQLPLDLQNALLN